MMAAGSPLRFLWHFSDPGYPVKERREGREFLLIEKSSREGQSRRVVEMIVKWSHVFHPVVMGVSAKEEK
jgi:hypothetical protein